MYGTAIARVFARTNQDTAANKPGVFERSEGVLAVVLASTVITSVCSYVVVSNALDARYAQLATAELTTVETASAPTIDPTPQRRYPDAGTFDTTVSVVIDRTPGARLAPQLAPAVEGVTSTPAPSGAPAAPVTVIAGRPSVRPLPRPGTSVSPAEVEVVTMARGMDAARAATLPRPTTRPDTTTRAALPDLTALPGLAAVPQGTSLLAASSPRPNLRPNNLVTRVAVRPGDLGIEVARAETPDALGGVGESPRPNIFSGGGGNGDCSARLARAIPRRAGNASGGAAVMARVGNGSGSERDTQLAQELMAGNVPSHTRDLHPVTFNGTVGGRTVEVTICVTPDYLAVGSDSDNIRVPLGLPAALRVADAFDMMLPTTTMVDAIYSQADVRIAPSPMTPGSSMSSTNYFVRHDATVDGQFARAGARAGMLVAGHKKDLVVANRLSRNPGRVAIYGWHRTNGRAIQALSTVHGSSYADYSHGIRLVSRTAFVNGRAVDLRDLLTDERYARFLNSDGALTGATVRLASL